MVEVDTLMWIHTSISSKLSTACCPGRHIRPFIFNYLHKMSQITELTKVKLTNVFDYDAVSADFTRL